MPAVLRTPAFTLFFLTILYNLRLLPPLRPAKME